VGIVRAGYSPFEYRREQSKQRLEDDGGEQREFVLTAPHVCVPKSLFEYCLAERLLLKTEMAEGEEVAKRSRHLVHASSIQRNLSHVRLRDRRTASGTGPNRSLRCRPARDANVGGITAWHEAGHSG